MASEIDTVASDFQIAIGIASGTGNRVWLAGGSLDNTGSSSAGRSTRTGGFTCGTMAPTSLGAARTEADLVSFDSVGFTLNWTTVQATAREFHYIAIA